jgi:hypothetical protein
MRDTRNRERRPRAIAARTQFRQAGSNYLSFRSLYNKQEMELRTQTQGRGVERSTREEQRLEAPSSKVMEGGVKTLG